MLFACDNRNGSRPFSDIIFDVIKTYMNEPARLPAVRSANYSSLRDQVQTLWTATFQCPIANWPDENHIAVWHLAHRWNAYAVWFCDS